MTNSTNMGYFAAKLVDAQSWKRIIKEPWRIWNFIKYMTAGIRGEVLRDERNNYLGTTLALAKLSERQGTTVTPAELHEVFEDVSRERDCLDLAELLARRGSDKSTTHDYHLIYGALLKGRRQQPLHILEIGLGTDNTDIPSNMGSAGKPGASVRAFRDWAPNAIVIGADIDRRILFSEERISTFCVDQTSVESLQALAGNFPKNSFDLIVDDGRHDSWANLNTLIVALDMIKDDGDIVIEDIAERYIPAWQIALTLLRDTCDYRLVRTKGAYVCLIRKK